MKAKYFTAKNREEAVELAKTYFECAEEEIIFELTENAEEAEYCELLAIVESAGRTANIDAWYTLYYESAGLYLELYKERGVGDALDSDELIRHLNRKKISGLEMNVVQTMIEKTMGRAMIARAQNEYVYGEEIEIEISPDESKASAVLLAPEPQGQLLSPDDIKRKLIEAGVNHGIDEQAIINFTETKDYGNSYTLAVSTPPEDGTDGKLLFNFSTDERTGSPKEISGGRVDYRSLDLYVSVEEGQLLVTRIAATEGTPGRTVRGNEIKQKPGKEIPLPKGKNISMNEERTEIYSTCPGMVEFVNNCVNVSNVFNIKGDCDLSVGNIDFDGCVNISGSVRSGSMVKATGGVVIGGSVEAATIIAGGNVEIKGGMQGADKGLIEAGGSVNILYVERGTVHADGPVTLDVSIHSIIETGDSLIAKGRRGAIIGGRVGSSGNVTANYIGALSNARTEVVVGIIPKKQARLKFLLNELERLSSEQKNLDKLDAHLQKSKNIMDPVRWDLLNRSSLENRRLNEEEINRCNYEKNELEYDLENCTTGKVHVFETVFSGSRVFIGQDAYVVNDEMSYVSFRNSNNNVVFGPCELVKGK